MPFRRLALVAVAALALPGCRSDTAPVQSGVFVLTSIDGRPLPTGLSSDPNAVVVVDEELSLDGNGVATRTRAVQGLTPSQVETSTVRYSYTLVDGVLTIGNVLCGPGALCVLHVPEQGVVAGDVLTLMASSSGPALVYRRGSLTLL